ncbi:hypothetical protein JRO89_XS06G0053600 [Xanthoceras sorbifolium]|uniref:Uncharacterized protein n=1 Tax=Xanthoceras sorbifolium TaxID=99658 RepID=A0ABQ8HWR6_9ROSI|nr:hypothetical protein JRO89_XS06G0053600 [Xanthoceras sorbifolium]
MESQRLHITLSLVLLSHLAVGARGEPVLGAGLAPDTALERSTFARYRTIRARYPDRASHHFPKKDSMLKWYANMICSSRDGALFKKANAKEKIGQLKKIVGEPLCRDVLKLAVMSVEHEELILNLQQVIADIWKDAEVRFNNVRLEQAGVVDTMAEKIRAMSDEIKKAVDGNKENEKEVEAKRKKPIQSRNNGCFIYNGPHRARDCPMKEQVNALASEKADTSDSNADVIRANCMQLLNTIRVVKQPPYNLMQVGIEIEVGLGTWRGKCMMNVIPLDDFEMVLGNEFFVKAKAALSRLDVGPSYYEDPISSNPTYRASKV